VEIKVKNQASKVMLPCVEASNANSASNFFTLLNLYTNFVLCTFLKGNSTYPFTFKIPWGWEGRKL